MQHPHCFHVDEEGCFHSEQFKEYCGLNTVYIKMAAGEAHWQNGIVERHIGTFRELLSKLLLEDMSEGADYQSVVEHVTEAKIAMEPTTAPHRANGCWESQDTHSWTHQRPLP